MSISDNFLSSRIVLLLFCVIFFFNSESHAFGVMQDQQREITGTVTDETGETLIGATIMVKGTTRGTQTDVNGEYTISAREGEILVFSYVGHIPIEITVVDQTEIDVVLETDETLLDEVVVV